MTRRKTPLGALPIRLRSGYAKPKPTIPPALLPALILKTESFANAEKTPSRRNSPSSINKIRPNLKSSGGDFLQRSRIQPVRKMATATKKRPQPNQRLRVKTPLSTSLPWVTPSSASSKTALTTRRNNAVRSQITRWVFFCFSSLCCASTSWAFCSSSAFALLIFAVLVLVSATF